MLSHSRTAARKVLTAVQGDFDGQSNRLTISKAFINAVTRSGIQRQGRHFFSANPDDRQLRAAEGSRQRFHGELRYQLHAYIRKLSGRCA
jgi:RNase P protein component